MIQIRNYSTKLIVDLEETIRINKQKEDADKTIGSSIKSRQIDI